MASWLFRSAVDARSIFSLRGANGERRNAKRGKGFARSARGTFSARDCQGFCGRATNSAAARPFPPLEFPARSGERPCKNVIALSSPRRFTPINLRNSSPESRPLRADLLPEYPPFRSFCAAYKLPFLATRLLFSFPPVGSSIVSAPPRELSLSDGTEPAVFRARNLRVREGRRKKRLLLVP